MQILHPISAEMFVVKSLSAKINMAKSNKYTSVFIFAKRFGWPFLWDLLRHLKLCGRRHWRTDTTRREPAGAFVNSTKQNEIRSLLSLQLTGPPLLTHRSRCFCPEVSGWGWGRWRGRRLKCGTSAATGSSGQTGRGCREGQPSTGRRICVSSEPSGTGTGGTVDTSESVRWVPPGWVSYCCVW